MQGKTFRGWWMCLLSQFDDFTAVLHVKTYQVIHFKYESIKLFPKKKSWQGVGYLHNFKTPPTKHLSIKREKELKSLGKLGTTLERSNGPASGVSYPGSGRGPVLPGGMWVKAGHTHTGCIREAQLNHEEISHQLYWGTFFKTTGCNFFKCIKIKNKLD